MLRVFRGFWKIVRGTLRSVGQFLLGWACLWIILWPVCMPQPVVLSTRHWFTPQCDVATVSIRLVNRHPRAFLTPVRLLVDDLHTVLYYPFAFEFWPHIWASQDVVGLRLPYGEHVLRVEQLFGTVAVHERFRVDGNLWIDVSYGQHAGQDRFALYGRNYPRSWSWSDPPRGPLPDTPRDPSCGAPHPLPQESRVDGVLWRRDAMLPG